MADTFYPHGYPRSDVHPSPAYRTFQQTSAMAQRDPFTSVLVPLMDVQPVLKPRSYRLFQQVDLKDRSPARVYSPSRPQRPVSPARTSPPRRGTGLGPHTIPSFLRKEDDDFKGTRVPLPGTHQPRFPSWQDEIPEAFIDRVYKEHIRAKQPSLTDLAEYEHYFIRSCERARIKAPGGCFLTCLAQLEKEEVARQAVATNGRPN